MRWEGVAVAVTRKGFYALVGLGGLTLYIFLAIGCVRAFLPFLLPLVGRHV